MISYQIEKNLPVSEFKSVLIRSTLGERRPVEDDSILADMIKHGNLIVTARDGATLVGISRSLTDFTYTTYLSDLAVDVAYQKQGIGKELIRQTKLATPKAKLTLLAAPDAIHYYPRIGLTQFEQCYRLNDVSALK